MGAGGEEVGEEEEEGVKVGVVLRIGVCFEGSAIRGEGGKGSVSSLWRADNEYPRSPPVERGTKKRRRRPKERKGRDRESRNAPK